MTDEKYSFKKFSDKRESIVTTIDSNLKFPESMERNSSKYFDEINEFFSIALNSESSSSLLKEIRTTKYSSKKRMTFLKLFRRCVCPVLDTEKTKKIKSIPTKVLTDNYSGSFKEISVFKKQINGFQESELSVLCSLLGEYDSRGTQGYELTNIFFNWFKKTFKGEFEIDGPIGAGRDIELGAIFSDFNDSFPCDFIIKDTASGAVCCVGFARYDSTRGGAQSDDRTGGNANKVDKARKYQNRSGNKFRIFFLTDGPGLTHKDTWEESCALDELWDDNVRVCSIKTAELGLTKEWLRQ